MYRINKSANNVVKLEKRLFKDLKIKEREHLQEWIAKNPEMLGEDLLIIQKEFDGFNDTHERLDLLAIDKMGDLVIIENKLDDTGRNVVWQALKYTSYCSTLTTAQIIKMYQSYLDQNSIGGDAKEAILEFLETSDDEDLLLNSNDQRIIFVSNSYRKEVTSTVLWLLNHDIGIQCFRATPYSMGDEIFLQVEQIIPLPETKEYMIDAKEKEKEEKYKSKAVEQSSISLIKFWNMLKNDFKTNKVDFVDKVTAKPYYDIGFWRNNGRFGLCIGRSTFRVELYFSDDIDKHKFDAMYQYKDQIEKAFDGEIIWERLDNKKATRIKHEMPHSILSQLEGRFHDEIYWEKLITWYREAMLKFYKAIYPYLEKIQVKS